jgi:hypothetical protein
MSGWSALDRILTTDDADGGCGTAMDLLHAYADLASRNPDEARARYPQVAAHLRQCGPCAEDLQGLLQAIQPPGDPAAE